jgi:hypothetical protein
MRLADRQQIPQQAKARITLDPCAARKPSAAINAAGKRRIDFNVQEGIVY